MMNPKLPAAGGACLLFTVDYLLILLNMKHRTLIAVNVAAPACLTLALRRGQLDGQLGIHPEGVRERVIGEGVLYAVPST